MRAKVVFNYVDEFLKEPEINGIHNDIMRATKVFTNSKMTPLRYLTVEAAFETDEYQVIKLEQYCGGIMGDGTDGSSKKVLEKAEKILEDIKKFCEEFGLHYRAGRFEL